MDLHAALTARLAEPDAAVALSRLAVEHVFGQPVSTFINPERVDFWLDHAFDEGALADAIEQHARGFVEREKVRAAERGDRVRDWVSAEAQAELRALAARPVDLDRPTIERLVDQDAVRSILRAVVRETLDRFVETVRPGGAGGGLFGAVGRGALGFASRASRGVLGNLGGQIEDLLRGAVITFVNGSMGLMVERFIDILMQPETRRQLGRMRLSMYDRAMKTDTFTLWKAAAGDAALNDMLETLPGLVAHNLDRPEVRAVIRAELIGWLEVEGERTLGDFLPAEHREALRDEVAALAAPMVTGFVASSGFAAWAAGASTSPATEGEPPEGEVGSTS